MRFVPYIKVFIKGLLAFLLVYIVFLFFMLPTADLGYFVSSSVSNATRGQVTLQFEDMSFIPFPSLSGTFQKVFFEMRGMPAINAESISLSASPFGLIGLQMSMPAAGTPKANDEQMKAIASNLSAQVEARGLFNGDMELDVSPKGKVKDGNPLHGVKLDAENFSLVDILKNFDIAFPLKSGNVSLNTDLKVDYLFQTQPEGLLGAKLTNIAIPPESVETPAGPIILPNLKISEINAAADIKDGIIRFTQVKIGKGNDPLTGKICGTLAASVRKSGSRMNPIIGDFELDVDLQMTEELHSELELLFLLVSAFKTQEAGKVRYAFHMKGSPTRNPQYSKLRACKN